MNPMRPFAFVRSIVMTAVLAASLLSISATGARAATFYADAARPDDTGDGRSWAGAKKTLQAAIDAAAAAGGGEVWVKAGTYKENRTTPDGALVMKSNVQLYGGFAGGEIFRDQRDPAVHPTTISGSKVRAGYSAYHVIRMDSTVNCRLDGFTLTGVNIPTSGSFPDDWDRGGGIYGTGVDETNLIANCVLSNNMVSSAGAGMYFSNSSPVLEHCTFRSNFGQAYGGGIFYEKSPGRTMTLTDCTFSGNMSEMGGGLYALDAAVALTSCTFSGNQAGPWGGAAWLSGVDQSHFDRCTFIGNQCNAGGGAIHCQSASPVIVNCVFSGNAALYGSGGALDILQAPAISSAPPLVNHCTMVNNTAKDGGAICLVYTSTMMIHNSIFTGNTGKAVYEYDSYADPVLWYCLFYNNPDGDYLDEGTLDKGHEGGVVKTGAAALNALLDFTGTPNKGNISGDPKLTGLYRLDTGSLAIDQGDPLAIPPATDIEGRDRPFDVAGVGVDGTGAVDIGAFEFGGILEPVFTLQPISQVVDLHGSVNLTVATTGTAPITYFWFRNKVLLSGATSSTLTIPDATLADEGDYVCRASHGMAMNATSRTVRVEVLTPATLSASLPSVNFLKDTRWAVDVEKGGAPTTQTLTLTNTGEKPLVFTGGDAATPGLTLTGTSAADFRIDKVNPATTSPLAPGGALTVTVKFLPHQTKRTLGLSAQFLVTTDSPVTPTLAIPLLGDAVPVELSVFAAE